MDSGSGFWEVTCKVAKLQNGGFYKKPAPYLREYYSKQCHHIINLLIRDYENCGEKNTDRNDKLTWGEGSAWFQLHNGTPIIIQGKFKIATIQFFKHQFDCNLPVDEYFGRKRQNEKLAAP